ncbi:hypothetical protein [Streptomyces sp. MST-110588]|uniref:hypothetical protein n=1 Tax=Streptomyces sp. MST-110588 TaxID=2833628 RepID=UPI001F5D375E|nr:hypothetical protein [Streptomyces sp. MST-110588]UNO42433.1 hypothetical protein KGS77_26545 [Streptomyces sp. MST-110588]
MPVPYQVAPAPDRTAPYAHPPGLPVMRDLPPGIEVVTLPGGVRTLAYTQPPAAAPTAPVAGAAQPIPVWAKTIALLAPTTGFGVAASGIGISYAAPGVIAVSHALWAAVAFIATCGVAAAAVLNRCRRPAPITQHITARGLLARANGTVNHH